MTTTKSPHFHNSWQPVREHRRYARPLAVRDDLKSEAGHTIAGHAAVFFRADKPETQYMLWEYGAEICYERIMPGAFDSALTRGDDVVCLLNHDPNHPLGRNGDAGTLTLAVDATGLAFRCVLPDTSSGRDVLTSVTRKDLKGCSFSFRILKQSWSEESKLIGDKTFTFAYRHIEDVELYDVGPVTFPAYDGTDVEANAKRQLAEYRAAAEWQKSSPDDLSDSIARGIATRRRMRLQRLRRVA